ncbi:hypothetical protein [Clostridium perfringens]|uniref:hypothetical protein n=1 Tax=Clostridium perfringens TaxID=1502 RepID=UPI000D71D1C0|nr:hypothetical protein [Clostridium perfringens]PWX49446.1 hypothetical protein CYK61_10210 [Clostridium perfringens]
MKINPSEKRDYEFIIEDCIKKMNNIGINFSVEKLDEFINLNCTYKKVDILKDKGMIKVIDSCIGVLIVQYNEILRLYRVYNNMYTNEMINFYKIIIYDFIDFRNSINIFIGIQLQGLVRSIIEHTRMYLCCMFDIKFREYYFENYSIEEKKARYYEKRGTKIDSMLDEICEIAIKNGEKMTPRSMLKAINTDELYKKIHDEFSELTHLNEFTMARNLINSNLELCFDSDVTWKYDKYYDYILEYMLITVIIIFIQNNEVLKSNYKDNTVDIYNLLFSIYISLFKYRSLDKVLVDLKNKALKIYNGDE